MLQKVRRSGERRDLLLYFLVNLGTGLFEFFGFLGEAFFDLGLFFGVFANVLGDFHAAELGAAHGAEVRDFGGILRECFIVKRSRGGGVQR